jgi:hypothetical protein
LIAGTVPAMSRPGRPKRGRYHRARARPEQRGGPRRRKNLTAQRRRGGRFSGRRNFPGAEVGSGPAGSSDARDMQGWDRQNGKTGPDGDRPSYACQPRLPASDGLDLYAATNGSRREQDREGAPAEKPRTGCVPSAAAVRLADKAAGHAAILATVSQGNGSDAGGDPIRGSSRDQDAECARPRSSALRIAAVSLRSPVACEQRQSERGQETG